MEQTRTDLIDQAVSMITRKGIAGLSVRALADNLDYASGNAA